MEIVQFGSNDIENKLASMNKDQFDDVAFGAIQLDENGTIIKYNAAEGDITGRDPEAVVGKNFFTDVAPCTNSKEFKGKFDEGVKNGDLNTMFEYTFDYEMKPTKVKVHMKKALTGDTYWVFVKRL
ncbi:MULTISPECIES: photoactive yellow protein [unclassified Idiomarina]|jgi:photoactive yellow protein|uniref:photoactive yellow protein n=1 Tax=unclassified Idiomarina TaxID=2614829 RepID=UPI000C94EAA9|nr:MULTISPECIES: photoactive yellow protein [unclassified Idiomarina]MAD54730.1 photoactive yellow protein [Idiomarinaceae bacterium]NQZ03507.1 photoactive yellow protein [Idiomarina sp.]|tara:strand:- start:4906 stop:5283 length:378 start_codon:yes stop_codon:yes gene_type:complete